jgi:hypothetical protein
MRINRLLTASVARPFTGSSGLRWTVARMITTNSLAAFSQEVARTRPALGGAPAGVDAPRPADRAARGPEPVAERRLEALPPAPSKPVPRGSLLDLRV